jgi:ABC-type multidrug transport system ATPase subunit
MKIACEALTKSYGSVLALDDLSLTIEPGQIVSLLGPNGAGKTTLLRCLASIAAPNRGRILYDGNRFHRGRIDLRRRLSFVPDFPLLFANMTILRHIGMALRLYQVDRDGIEQRLIEILRHLDLLTFVDTKLGSLSRGQTYKAALAAHLAVNPELWLLDEPFASGMDPGGITFFKRCARDAATKGRTVIYSTQILEIAEGFSDRVCLFHRGRLRLCETVDELRRQTRSEVGILQGLFAGLREESM